MLGAAAGLGSGRIRRGEFWDILQAVGRVPVRLGSLHAAFVRAVRMAAGTPTFACHQYRELGARAADGPVRTPWYGGGRQPQRRGHPATHDPACAEPITACMPAAAE